MSVFSSESSFGFLEEGSEESSLVSGFLWIVQRWDRQSSLRSTLAVGT